MGSREKTTVETQSSGSATPQATPEQRELNQLQLDQAKAFDPTQRLLNQNAGNTINALLTGNTDALPGFLGTLAKGINPDVTNTLVNQSLRDVNTQLAKSGAGTMMESGASQAIGARTAGDIRTSSEQFNLQNLLQMLNIGVGGQASVQQPTLATAQMLGSRLQGLNSMNYTGNSNQTTLGMNPFMKSFQTSLGSGFGTGISNFTFGAGK